MFYAATFPMVFNTWSGVRSVNPLWLRAAGAMGADENSLFWKVIIPGASPFIITGMRQAFLRAWIAVVGAEMIAASDWGLGWVIFDAKEFLNTDIMLAALIVIGAHRLPVRTPGVRLDRARHRAALGHVARGEGLARDPEKWEPVSRLREARFGGRSKVRQDYPQGKMTHSGLAPVSLMTPTYFALSALVKAAN